MVKTGIVGLESQDRAAFGYREPAGMVLPWFALDNLAGFEREQFAETLAEHQKDPAVQLVCTQCGTVITDAAARCERQGAHIHVYSNPLRVRFLIGCFATARTTQRGEPTREHTWFPGYAWEITHCPECHMHLGWRFSGKEEDVFFGLITDRLREERHPAG